MTQKLELRDEDIKSVIIATIPMSKKTEERISMLRKDSENIKKTNSNF